MKISEFNFNPTEKYESISTKIKINGPGLTKIDPTTTISGITTTTISRDISPIYTLGLDHSITWIRSRTITTMPAMNSDGVIELGEIQWSTSSTTGVQYGSYPNQQDPIIVHYSRVDRTAQQTRPLIFRIKDKTAQLIEIDSGGQELIRFSFDAEKLFDIQVVSSDGAITAEHADKKVLEADLVVARANYLQLYSAYEQIQKNAKLAIDSKTAILEAKLSAAEKDLALMHTAMQEAVAKAEALQKQIEERNKYLDRFAIDE